MMYVKETICILLFVIVFLLYPLYGAEPYSFTGLLQFFLFPDHQTPDPELVKTIIVNLRLPRLLAGLLCGSALALAGVLSQGLFRNPLAAPGILGFSGGSSLCVLLLYITGLQWIPSLSVPGVAFVGAMLSSLILIALTRRFLNRGFGYLLLCGMALSSLWGALNSFLISVSMERYEILQAMMRWMLGGLNACTWETILQGSLPTLCGLVWALSFARKLDVLALGHEVAESLSVDVAKLRLHCLACMSLLVAMVISIAGPLPFVGLIVPHMCRMIFGPSHHKLMIFSMLNGCTLIMLADLMCRSLLAPRELELGVLTSLLGAPFFFYLLFRRREDLC